MRLINEEKGERERGEEGDISIISCVWFENFFAQSTKCVDFRNPRMTNTLHKFDDRIYCRISSIK